MLTSRLSPDERERRLADTYKKNSWETVEDYQRVQSFKREHPDATKGDAVEALGLDGNYIHNWWYTDTKPAAVNGIEIAREHGWLDSKPGDRVFEAFVVLHAWILAGGSIGEANKFPSWIEKAPENDVLEEALDAIGCGSTIRTYNGHDRHPERRPADHGVVLARFLYGVLDAPRGRKIRSGVAVPAWVNELPEASRRRWARTYVSVRGLTEDTRAGVFIREYDRPDAYYDDLVDVFGSVLDDPSGVWRAKDIISFDATARNALYVVPDLPA